MLAYITFFNDFIYNGFLNGRRVVLKGFKYLIRRSICMKIYPSGAQPKVPVVQALTHTLSHTYTYTRSTIEDTNILLKFWNDEYLWNFTFISMRRFLL